MALKEINYTDCNYKLYSTVHSYLLCNCLKRENQQEHNYKNEKDNWEGDACH